MIGVSMPFFIALGRNIAGDFFKYLHEEEEKNKKEEAVFDKSPVHKSPVHTF